MPVSRLPALLDGLAKLTAKHRVANVNFGHGGNGNIHVNLLVDPGRGDELERAEAASKRSSIWWWRWAARSRASTVSAAEARVDWEGLDATTIGLMRNIKQVFDPADILNPGKLFPDQPGPPDRARLEFQVHARRTARDRFQAGALRSGEVPDLQCNGAIAGRFGFTIASPTPFAFR